MKIACLVELLHGATSSSIWCAKVVPARRKYAVLKATVNMMIKTALSGLSQLSSGPRWRIRDIIHLDEL